MSPYLHRSRPLAQHSLDWATLCLFIISWGCVDSIPPSLPMDYEVIREVCGDNILSRNEQCEDGNLIDGDGCSSQCLIEVNPMAGETAGSTAGGLAGEPAGEIAGEPAGEVAGEPAGEVAGEPAGEVAGEPAGEVAGEPAGELAGDPAGELAGESAGEPTGFVCGDGVMGPGEECDDGNQESGDGCSAACQIEVEACVDDAFEPNSNIASASVIQAGDQLSSLNAMLCEGDVDVYEIMGCAGGDLEIVVNFDVNAMDLDLRLTDDEGRLLGSSAVALATEQLSERLSADGPVYLEVYGYLDQQEGAYQVNVSLTGCDAIGCMIDAECAPGEVCASGRCVEEPQVECRVDNDCDSGERCVNTRCEAAPPECTSDDECDADEVCVNGSCVPENPDECVLSADCPVGQICQANACVEVGLQVDDRFEENDDVMSATPVMSGEYTNLVLLTRDDDFFSLEVCAGGTINASITFSHALGDLELRLLDSSELPLDTSALSSDEENVAWTNRASAAETVYLQVYGFLDDNNRYTLTTQVIGCGEDPVDPLTPDRFEENDVFTDAVNLAPGSYDNLTMTNNDDDWYSVDVCEGGTLNVTTRFSHAQGNLDAWLYDSALSSLDLSVSFTDQEALSTTVTDAERLYIKIYGFGVEADYGLDISVSGCQVGLGDDRLEDNDTRETGSLLTPNLYGNLTITPEDEDWILVDVCEGGTLNAEITFSHAEGDLELRLYNANGTSIESSLSSDDDESITESGLAAGRYALRVYGVFRDQGRYDLTFSVTDCAPAGLSPDRLEDNDTRETGSLLTPNIYGNLTITAGDEDWILLDVCEGGTVTIDLLFSHAEGDIDARLYKPDNISATSSLSSDDNENLVYANATAGRYSLNIFSYGDTENTYELRFTITNCGTPGGGDELEADRLEENDTQATGEVLLPNLYSNLTITSGDEDWVLFDVCEGGDIEVEINFSHADGDLDMTLYDEDGVEIIDSDSASDDELINYNSVVAGRYAIKVYGYLGSENRYDLTIRVFGCP